MKKGRFSGLRKNIIILGAGIILTAVGFMVGRTAQAEAPTPGTAGDPLVSQSYVQAQVDAKTKALQLKITQLEEKAAKLETQIKVLEQQ